MHAIIVHVMNAHSLQKIDVYAPIAIHIACIVVFQYYTTIYIAHALAAIMIAALFFRKNSTLVSL
jgi:hypothetical protein